MYRSEEHTKKANGRNVLQICLDLHTQIHGQVQPDYTLEEFERDAWLLKDVLTHWKSCENRFGLPTSFDAAVLQLIHSVLGEYFLWSHTRELDPNVHRHSI